MTLGLLLGLLSGDGSSEGLRAGDRDRQSYLPAIAAEVVLSLWGSEDGMPLRVAQTQNLAFIS